MIVTLSTTPALQRTMTFESLAIDSVNRAASVHEYASGKGINVARVVHTLGQSCAATGFLGGDSGAFCRHDMDAAGMGHDFVTVAGKTRMCVTLDRSQEPNRDRVDRGSRAVTQSDAAKLFVKLELLLQHARVFVLSGTVAPGCGDDFYARASGSPTPPACRSFSTPRGFHCNRPAGEAVHRQAQSRRAFRNGEATN